MIKKQLLKSMLSRDEKEYGFVNREHKSRIVHFPEPKNPLDKNWTTHTPTEEDLDKMFPQDPVVESHKSPITELVNALKTDEGYYIGWKANIAMAFFDEARRNKAKISIKNLHEIANTAADNFLQLLIK